MVFHAKNISNFKCKRSFLFILTQVFICTIFKPWKCLNIQLYHTAKIWRGGQGAEASSCTYSRSQYHREHLTINFWGPLCFCFCSARSSKCGRKWCNSRRMWRNKTSPLKGSWNVLELQGDTSGTTKRNASIAAHSKWRSFLQHKLAVPFKSVFL